MSKTLCADDGLWAIAFQRTDSKVHVTYAKTTLRFAVHCQRRNLKEQNKKEMTFKSREILREIQTLA